MRVASTCWASQIPKLQVYLFRRLFPDLIKNHMEGPSGFRAILAPWVDAKLVQITEDEIRFLFNGSKIYLCHCKDEKDRFKYQGAEIHVLLVDEATHFTEQIYNFLRSRVRATGLTLPKEFEGRFPRILISANPGNVGHLFIKRNFIDQLIPYEAKQMPKEEGGMVRQYIPAKLEDNPTLAVEDPLYADRVAGLGSPELVRAMRDGDWNVVVGAYFPEFGESHIVPPQKLPDNWNRIAGMDWGYATPFAIYWAAISDGVEYDHEGKPFESRFPKDSLVVYREWYGSSGPNEGLRLPVGQMGQGIKKREKSERITYRVAGHDIFEERGGPSMAEQFHREGVLFRRADNKRIPGWQQIRGRLMGKNGKPMIYFFSTCEHLIRTLPAMIHDLNDLEDLDTDLEDHAADAIRFLCMSRPWGTPVRQKPVVKTLQNITFNELLEMCESDTKKGY